MASTRVVPKVYGISDEMWRDVDIAAVAARLQQLAPYLEGGRPMLDAFAFVIPADTLLLKKYLQPTA